MAYTSNENNSGLLKNGEYECVIDSISEKPYGSEGKVYLSIQYRVRNDVEQDYKNAVVFESLFKSRETNDYSDRRIGNLLYCSGLPKGETKNDIDEVIDFCKGRYIRVVVETVKNTYKDKEENVVKFYKPTKFDLKATSISKKEEVEELDDDSLPFWLNNTKGS